MATSNVEELAIGSSVDIHSLAAVLEGVLKEHGEEDAKKHWCKDTTLFNTVADRKGLGCGTIKTHCAAHVVVKRRNNSKQVWGAANFFEKLKESASAHHIKCFC